MKLSSLAASVALLAATLSIGSVAEASTSAPSKVYNITITANGIAYFFQEASRTGYPACAGNFPARWAFNASTPGGQAVLSTILTAYATNKPVFVAGTGACDVAGDTESVGYLYIVDR